MSAFVSFEKRDNIIQLLVFEEPNIKFYWCVKVDISQCEVEVNITFHTPINLDIRLFKHQLLFYYFLLISLSFNNLISNYLLNKNFSIVVMRHTFAKKVGSFLLDKARAAPKPNSMKTPPTQPRNTASEDTYDIHVTLTLHCNTTRCNKSCRMTAQLNCI